LFYAKQFAGGDIIQPDDISKAGPVEMIQDDAVVTSTAQVALEAPSDEAQFVPPARGVTVRNSFGDSIGRLDPGTKPVVRTVPRRRTAAMIASAAWRGIKKAGRVLCCCSLM